MICAALALCACGTSHASDAGLGRDAGPPPPPPTRIVDILFVVENAGGVTEEEWSLWAELPRFMDILMTGDFDQDGDGHGDGEIDDEDFPAVTSLQIGMVSTDMGTGGFTGPTCARADFGDDGILQSRGRTDLDGCLANYPRFLSWRPTPPLSSSEFARDVGCVLIGLGTDGCGFEQQLEATLKAISPSGPTSYTADDFVPPTFFRNTSGHADTSNDGFLREDSLLAVVMLTGEDDCSASDPELFNPDSTAYGRTDLNLRCYAHADAALHPIERYVDGLLGVRRHPSRLVFGVIAGIPTDLVDPPGAAIDWDRLISEDLALRDRRMQERIDPAMPSRLIPSCNVPGRGQAFPPVRILRVARGLEARGARVSVGSQCQESFRAPMAAIIEQLVR